MNFNPARLVLEQARLTPDALALFADEEERSYRELTDRAARLAAALHARGIGSGSRVGILASRSLVAVESVLGVLWAGSAYVPLGPKWPSERLATVMARSRPRVLVVDGPGLDLVSRSLMESVEVLVLPSAQAAESLPVAGRPALLFLDELPSLASQVEPASMASEDLVYIIFTSGTTGTPKGVMASAGSLAAYLDALASRKAMTPSDRASQFTELTFDPSIGEIFVPWRSGASLHVVPAVSKVSPAKFVRDRALTIWGSAPAAIAWMRATRALQPGSLPTLRYSSFGGEPLPLASVRAWQEAAPDSAVDNLYGPTEATVDCVGQLLPPGADPVVTPGRGILAIGVPHAGTKLAVLGPELEPMPDGEAGELAIGGKQVTLGYLDEPELTAERFPILRGERWYLTGDLAMRDAAGMHHHLGRMDHQIKIQGHRVELEEVEAHLRSVAGVDQVAAVAWPFEDGVAQAIVGFVAGSPVPAERIRDGLRLRVPAYMVPEKILVSAELPLNANGKIDRPALVARLGGSSSNDR